MYSCPLTGGRMSIDRWTRIMMTSSQFCVFTTQKTALSCQRPFCAGQRSLRAVWHAKRTVLANNFNWWWPKVYQYQRLHWFTVTATLSITDWTPDEIPPNTSRAPFVCLDISEGRDPLVRTPRKAPEGSSLFSGHSQINLSQILDMTSFYVPNLGRDLCLCRSYVTFLGKRDNFFVSTDVDLSSRLSMRFN